MKISKHISLRHIKETGKYYLFCSATGDHFELNQSAYDILTYFKDGKNYAQIKRLLQDEYGVDEETVMQDIEDMAAFLKRNNLLTKGNI